MSDITHTRDHGQGSYASYITGFVTSVAITVGAYLVVTHHVYTDRKLVFALMGLAIVQLAVQLIFFLHLGHGSKSRWNVLLFGFMLMVVLIVVGGSLWIMYHLNYHMSPHDVTKYLSNQDSL